jgi:glutamate--cysteine ligase
MTDRIVRTATPVHSVAELVARFSSGQKDRARFRLGAEHEKIGVSASGDRLGAPVPYHGPRGIEVLFERLVGRGWTPVSEDGHIVALSRGVEKMTLEPGGQLELSADPLATLRAVEDELSAHLAELAQESRPLGIAWLGLGFRPFDSLDDVAWVPKGRYGVMRTELPLRGRLAHEMMKRTATVQANLDYADEADAARKLRAGMSVTSIVTALFASSPLVDGQDSGYQSYRASVWLETDPTRCGLLPFAFEDDPIFTRYTDWALDVPMLFLYRGGRYFSVGGMTFRRFLHEGFQGEPATIEDWETHLTTLFPEVRLKNYLEVRGADAGPVPMVLALPALWKGLLYDADACEAATALTAGLSFEERQTLRATVPREGLATRLPDGRRVVDTARELVAIARAGLERQDPEEASYLAPLEEIAATGVAVADRVREVWRAAGGDRARLIEALRL